MSDRDAVETETEVSPPPAENAGGGTDERIDEAGLLDLFCTGVATDLETFAALHDREIRTEMVKALKESDFPMGLALMPGGVGDDPLAEAAQAARDFMREAVQELPDPFRAEDYDLLAAEFAAIYLNFTYRAAPLESPWIDEEGLVRQEPMFQVRAWYRRFGLEVEDWRDRSDDHLVLQLRFAAHLLRLPKAAALAAGKEAPAGEAIPDPDADPRLVALARFLDQHLLRWIKSFAEGVARYSRSGFYAALAVLTASYVTELRQVLAEVTGLPVPDPEAERAKAKANSNEVRAQAEELLGCGLSIDGKEETDPSGA